MPTKTKRVRPSKAGRLRIGNQWNAINIIAKSQTHPLKAVCELVENALDARARSVHILRARRKGNVYLELHDDGQGVVLNEVGEPDFAHIATHICDSMKRHLDSDERQGVHGEFGIGLLSFWSLGEQLRIASADAGGRLQQMVLECGKRSYNIQTVRGQLATGGTRVTVGPLLPSTRNILTGEKLNRYLSVELRDRIRTTGVQIRIADRVSRKNFLVAPKQFEGDALGLPAQIPTEYGDLSVELYIRQSGDSNGADGVAICKDGTRVLKSIAELLDFQRPPWTDARLEGVIDFPALHLAPGTRSGIIPDERFMALVGAVRSLEESLRLEIESRDKAESDKASRQILRQLQKAFVTALQELPENEYLFFDIPETASAVTTGPSGGSQGKSQEAVAVRAGTPRDTPDEAPESQSLLGLTAGPLAGVRITPRHPRRRPGQQCLLTATALDEQGIVIDQGIEIHWSVADGEAALLDADGLRCRVESDRPGLTVVCVQATAEGITVTDQVTVKYLENVEEKDEDTGRGLPTYQLQPEYGKPWRSRYDEPKNVIIINSAHRDFLSGKATMAKHRRYIGKLYAKEVVLINFPHESPGHVMERLIEITLRTEDSL